MNDVHGPFGPHHRQFGRRPSDVVVALQVLAGHRQIGAPVGFSSHQRQLRHRGFGVGKQQLSTVTDDAAPLLDHAGQKAGNVLEGEQRDVEGVAGSDEASRFDGRIDVKAPGQNLGLIANHAHRVTVHSGKPNDDVVRIQREEFHELAVVHHVFHHMDHVVGFVGVVRDDVLQRIVGSLHRVTARHVRWVGHVVVGQIRQQRSGQFTGLLFVFGDQRGDA